MKTQEGSSQKLPEPALLLGHIAKRNHSAVFPWPATNLSVGSLWQVSAVIKEKKLRRFQKCFEAGNKKSCLNHCAVFVIVLQMEVCHFWVRCTRRNLLDQFLSQPRCQGRGCPSNHRSSTFMPIYLPEETEALFAYFMML